MPTTYDAQRNRLAKLVKRAEQSYLEAKTSAALRGQRATVRHKCFISYHGGDIDEVTDFVEEFNDVFIPRVIGVSDSDQFQDPISSHDEEYIKERIGSKYLSDSTVTILFVGKCAWSRRYIDWELSSTLRDGKVNKRGGLMAVRPRGNPQYEIPARFADNWFSGSPSKSYARLYRYPSSEEALRVHIEDAFQAREGRAHLINNTRSLRRRNSAC